MKQIQFIQILNSLHLLREMSQVKMPLATSAKIRKVIDEANRVTAGFEPKRAALLEKFDIPDTDPLSVPPDTQEDFDQAWNDLVSEMVEVTVPTVTMDEIGGSFAIEPANITLVDWFVKVHE